MRRRVWRGKSTEIPLTESTIFTDADGNSITYADLEEGSRVVVTWMRMEMP